MLLINDQYVVGFYKDSPHKEMILNAIEIPIKTYPCTALNGLK